MPANSFETYLCTVSLLCVSTSEVTCWIFIGRPKEREKDLTKCGNNSPLSLQKSTQYNILVEEPYLYHQVEHHYSASGLWVHPPCFQSEHLRSLYCDQIGHSVHMLYVIPQTLQTTPGNRQRIISHADNTLMPADCYKHCFQYCTLISVSETPKSRLETRSLLLLSALLSVPVLCPLRPPTCSSNMSCCHLSGNSLGCEEKVKLSFKVWAWEISKRLDCDLKSGTTALMRTF